MPADPEAPFRGLRGHRLIPSTLHPEMWGCLRCELVRSRKDWEAELAQCGEAVVPAGVGMGHRFTLLRGLWHCDKCGTWFEKTPQHKSVAKCMKPTIAGLAVLRRIQRGVHPSPVGQWPLITAIGPCGEIGVRT